MTFYSSPQLRTTGGVKGPAPSHRKGRCPDVGSASPREPRPRLAAQAGQAPSRRAAGGPPRRQAGRRAVRARQAVRVRELARAQGARRFVDPGRPALPRRATGDAAALAALLDEHPEKLHVRDKPYEWTLLHLAANGGHLACADLLLRRGLDVNVRESGDNTYAMHWAAAHGHLDVVRRLADAGGDVIGHGDDHELEDIGWAACTNPCHTLDAASLPALGPR